MTTSRTLLALLGLTLAASAENWPQWRGPALNGTSPEKNLPDQITAQSIKWKTELPGFSGATPAVWGDSIFLTSPDANKDLLLYCIDRKDGKKQWAVSGKPLYFWVKDKQKGDTTGDGVNNVWEAARP